MSARRGSGGVGVACVLASLWACLLAPWPVPAQTAPSPDEKPADYLEFVQEFSGNCVSRQGVQILVRSRHPTRRLRVWLDRFHMGVGTGDRSRTDLAPGGEPEALGCSRSLTGAQEWRLVRAAFVD